MGNLTILFGNGVKRDCENYTLKEAIEKAEELASYTQHNICILDENGKHLAISHWIGTKPTDDDDVLLSFGDYGYYESWCIMY